MKNNNLDIQQGLCGFDSSNFPLDFEDVMLSESPNANQLNQILT